MARSPLGVAMGVSGDVHTQVLQPRGQLPSAVGFVHATPVTTGPGTSQQMSPAAQQFPPQQSATPGH